MYVARIAPLGKRSIDLFDALNADNCTKLKSQELSSNVHICSVEGHVIAVEAKGDATEDCVADQGNVLLMADTSELICFNTKYVAGCPYPVHEVEPSELLEPKEHFFAPVVRALEPHILEFRIKTCETSQPLENAVLIFL